MVSRAGGILTTYVPMYNVMYMYVKIVVTLLGFQTHDTLNTEHTCVHIHIGAFIVYKTCTGVYDLKFSP